MRDLGIDGLLTDEWGRLLAQAGGALPIIIGAVFGAFAGLLLGMLLVKLVQFAAYLTGRRLEGGGLLSVCVLAGAVLGGWLSRPA
jgi:hypothetical protein